MVNGCQCHIIHNAAKKGGQIYSAYSGFDSEEFLIDLYQCFEHSTKPGGGEWGDCQGKGWLCFTNWIVATCKVITTHRKSSGYDLTHVVGKARKCGKARKWSL